MGTAFLVAVPMDENPDKGVVYAVTARHVIEGTRPFGSLSLRFNKIGDGYEDLWAPHETWTLSPTTDVAIAPLNVNFPDFEINYVSIEGFMTDEFVKKAEIGEGDEVFFVGLFSQHYGTSRSQPVVRFGNVALMPHEKVLVRTDPSSDSAPIAVDAYLVEARSWGGQSGSPAFCHFGLWRPKSYPTLDELGPRLLGLVHGHFDIKQDIRLIGDVATGASVSINAGMAIVIPAQEIFNTLMMEEVVEDREKRFEEYKTVNRMATSDSATNETGQCSRDDYIRDLKKASGPTPPEKEGS